MISIIIPTLNEEQTILPTLKSITSQKVPCEIIIVDGGSKDKTLQTIQKIKNLTLIKTRAGRAHQLNLGAKKAQHPILLFLHADVQLPKNSLNAILKTMQNKKIVGGAFYKTYQEKKSILNVPMLLANFKNKFMKIYFGNEGIFTRSSTFNKLKGFQDLPLMEDVDFSLRLKRLGKLKTINKKVTVSARRYINKGTLNQTTRNLLILFLYAFKVKPKTLKKIYTF